MASTSTNESQSMIMICCKDGKFYEEETEATKAVLLELNFSLPPARVNWLAFVKTRIMSMVINYCRYHDGEFVKLADPLTLFDLIKAAYHFDHKNLMDLTCQTLVSMVKRKSVKEIRTNFTINLDYDWNSNENPSKRAIPSCYGTLVSRKEAFIMPSDFVYVQRSRQATKALYYIYMGRWKSLFDFCVGKLLKAKSDGDLLKATRALSCVIEDQELADRLKHDHVVHLFNMLEQCTSRQEIQMEVLRILSLVNFTAHKKAMGPARIQLLVKAIDEKVFSSYNNEMTHLAVLTLTNIVKALPEFVVDILKTDVLECVKRVLLARRTVEIVDRIAMFLAAVSRTSDLSRLVKVDLALTTLQVLEIREPFKHHIEQACNTFQYLTYKMDLQIEELVLKKLIEKLIAIIQKPPPGNYQFPGYALGVFGNIAIWGSSDQIKILTSNSTFLESLEMAMMAGSKKIRKEACLIIANIAAKMEGLIEEMHAARLIEALCRLLEKDESDVKRDAAWAIYSVIYGSFMERE